jgi:hypothetical protein
MYFFMALFSNSTLLIFLIKRERLKENYLTLPIILFGPTP